MSPAQEREEAARSWTRVDWRNAFVLAAVVLLTWLPRLRGPIDLRFDAGVYYTLGTSLAEGRGYRLLNEPGEIHAVQYPPLLPALVAAHQLVLGSTDPLVVGPVLRGAYLVLALGYALASYAFARRFLDTRLALVAALVSVLHFHAVYLSDLLFAELPFALAVLGLLLADGARSRVVRASAGVFAATSFFLRTAGIAVLGAWALAALLRRDWRAFAGRAVLALACVGAWQGYVRSVTQGEEYARPAYTYQRAPYQYYNVSYAENVALLDPFRPEAGPITPSALAARLGENALTLGIALGETVSVARGYWEWPLRRLGRLIGTYVPLKPALVPILALALLVVGGFGLLWRRAPFAGLLLASSLLLIALTPWPAQFLRYLMPFAPLAAVALALAVAEVGSRLRGFTPAALVLVLGAQGACLAKTFVHYHHEVELPARVEARQFLFAERREWRAFYAGLEWLRTNTAPEAQVATSCPLLVWLHAGRKAVMPPLEADPAEAARLLDSVAIDYLVIDALAFVDMSRRYAAPVVTADPAGWLEVFRSGEDVVIYRRLR
jgi:hypothetical protein